MSKVFDEQLYKVIKEMCGGNYNTPTEFTVDELEEKAQSKDVFNISHSLNNLQRSGVIKIHMANPGERSKIELLKA